jgi:hypothetical protein
VVVLIFKVLHPAALGQNQAALNLFMLKFLALAVADAEAQQVQVPPLQTVVVKVAAVVEHRSSTLLLRNLVLPKP